MSKAYRVNEIFYSIQGEGVRAGTPAVFVRFAGCNLRCTRETVGFDCDTEHDRFHGPDRPEGGGTYTGAALSKAVLEIGKGCRWVIFTGGEPLLQVDMNLVRRFIDHGYRIALETNGTIQLPVDPLAFGWVAVSSKRGEKVQIDHCDELRVVLGNGDELWYPNIDFDHGVISPAFGGEKGDKLDPVALAWCIEVVKRNPSWRLSVQQHKGWGIR